MPNHFWIQTAMLGSWLRITSDSVFDEDYDSWGSTSVAQTSRICDAVSDSYALCMWNMKHVNRPLLLYISVVKDRRSSMWTRHKECILGTHV